MSLTTTNVGVRDDWIGTRNIELDGLMIRGDKPTIRRCGFLSGSIEQSTKGDLSPPTLRVFSYIIYFFLNHPSPTLVSHPCLYLSACPINHSIWHSVSCGELGSIVQRSCPHKWGQDISCGYLMQRWQFILELPLHYTPMTVSLHLYFPLGRSRRLPLVACRFLLRDLGLLRTRLSSATAPGSLDLLCLSSNISSSSAWASSLIWNGTGLPNSLAPQ